MGLLGKQLIGAASGLKRGERSHQGGGEKKGAWWVGGGENGSSPN